MSSPKVDLILKELRELKDATTKVAMESAAQRVERIMQDLELNTTRFKGRGIETKPTLSESPQSAG
jgi:hypothetical protein